jgi:hypothetical protein
MVQCTGDLALRAKTILTRHRTAVDLRRIVGMRLKSEENSKFFASMTVTKKDIFVTVYNPPETDKPFQSRFSKGKAFFFLHFPDNFPVGKIFS